MSSVEKLLLSSLCKSRVELLLEDVKEVEAAVPRRAATVPTTAIEATNLRARDPFDCFLES